MALTTDGFIISSNFGGGGSTDSVTLTTTKNQDLIVVVGAAEVTGTPHATGNGPTAAGLTFTKRSSLYVDSVAGPFGTSWNSLEVWSAPATSPLSAVTISYPWSKAIDTGVTQAFAVNFDGVSLPVWSSNVSLPHSGDDPTGTTTPSVASNSTNNAAVMLGFLMNSGQQATTPGSGYTIDPTNGQNQSGNGALACSLATEYQIFATAQSAITVAFATAWQTWLMIVDAVEAPGGGATGINIWPYKV